MTQQTTRKPPNPPRKPGTDQARRRVGQAIRLWAGVTLGGLAVVSGLALWHLRRRGRLLREGGSRAREVDWPIKDSDPTDSQPEPKP